jgi:hypothetical protein
MAEVAALIDDGAVVHRLGPIRVTSVWLDGALD